MKKVALISAIVALATACGPEIEEPTPNTVEGCPAGTVAIVPDAEMPVCELFGTITEDLTLDAGRVWLLNDAVYFGDGTTTNTLTVEPGTTVYGKMGSKAFLVIERNAKIIADGTEDAPIVFTSEAEVGARKVGDWGGIVINGKAPVNLCADMDDCNIDGEANTGVYGGNVADDDSGILRYVRVEFVGKDVDSENQLNGIGFQGVGSKTVIENIQVHMAQDDCIEFFGGTANFRNVLCTGIGDDNLDWTFGWTGKGEGLVVQQYDGIGERGIEADSNKTAGTTPVSKPTLSNITLIGAPESDVSDVGMLFRRGSGATIYNAVIVGFKAACIDVDGEETFDLAETNLTIENSVFACDTTFKMNDEKDDNDQSIEDPIDLEEFFLDPALNNSEASPEEVLNDPFNETAPDFSVKGSFTSKTVSDSFFEATGYVGGVDPSNPWTQNWTVSHRE